MAVTAVVGANWGDEGKGRMVDYLAQSADFVVRFQGGDNAGHTVINGYGKFALHMIPSGVFNPDTTCVVGAGTVVNPANVLDEMKLLKDAGLSLDNLLFDRRAHVVFPYHPELDARAEAARSGKHVMGTTKRGIGPTYAEKAARTGIRLGDLLRPDYLRERLESTMPARNRTLKEVGGAPVDIDALLATCEIYRGVLGDRIVDTLPIVREAVRAGKRVLLEGQLGIMRDLDWGIYPYSTSSNPTVGAACSGAGLPPTAIRDVLGVVKAYSTSVGAGPFPTEDFGPDGERLRDVGQEFGATTGRPRRCGWFDGVAIQYASWLNGFTALAVTKLDVLDVFEEIKVCVAYELDGERVTEMPDTPDQERVTPVYEVWPGWMESTRDARAWSDLPKNARRFLHRIAELAGAPIRYVSVGPGRQELVVLDTFGVEGLAE
ncbi:MAG: adenylosuccinate synthase [Myxococcales bacterium]|nr:adenylosuccinate synthase [Myxococcales bacterium]